jgi:hypothetical protein
MAQEPSGEPLPQDGQTTYPPLQQPQGQPERNKVYFYLDGKLVGLERDIPGGGQMVEFTINSLLEGPTQEERERGYSTAIPEGVRMRYSNVSTVKSEFSVNLSPELLVLKEDPERAKLAMRQIYYTVKEASGAEVVNITVDMDEEQMNVDAFTALGLDPAGVLAEDITSARATDNEKKSRWPLYLAISLCILFALILAALALLMIRRRREAYMRKPVPTRRRAYKIKR